jgi:hypothetical protein
MIYQIVSPVVATIEANSFKEAVKNFAKVNYNYNINQLIIKDQMNHYEAKLRYYTENEKNKVGITVYPYPYSQVVNSEGTPVLPFIGGPAVIGGPMVGVKTNPIITAPGMISTGVKNPNLPFTPVVVKYNS